MAKRRKVLPALLLALVMVVTTACSSGDENIKQPVNADSDSGVTSGNEATNGNAVDETGESVKDEISIAQTVLYDADGVVVTATGYEEGWFGPEVKLLVENNSDRNILVTSNSVSVNGYMMPYASLYAEVAAGKKSNESLSFMSSELEKAGIETLAEMRFYIQIQDPETWETVATSDLLTLSTSAAPYEQPVDDSGDVLFDDQGIKVVCKGLKQDIVWDGTVVFYMENNSGRAVSIYAENVSVNDFMQDVGLWSDLRDGTKIIDGMSLIDLSDLEIESIDQIESIEFNLRVVDAETWEEIVTTDVLTLTFQ